MKTRELNLARRPFVNVRPVRRLTLLLWVLGVALCALNVALFWQYFSTTDDSQHERAALQQRISQQQGRIATNKAALAKVDLLQLNAEVDFLNRRIAERTFPWSQLFDHLAEVLPNDVRLYNLAPKTETERRGRNQEALPGGRVRISIVGIAKTVEAELAFVDRLFAHPFFERPRLTGDSSQVDGLLRFNIDVTYLPKRGTGSLAVEGKGDGKTPIVAEASGEAAANAGPQAQGSSPTQGSSASGLGAASPEGALRPGASTPPPTAIAAAQAPAAGSRGSIPVRPSTSRGQGEDLEDSPESLDTTSRQNRRQRRSGSTDSPAAPTRTGGTFVLPQGASAQQPTATPPRNRRGSANRRRAPNNNPRRPSGPGIPVPGTDTETDPAGGIDPRDPRRPSPRTPAASSAQEIQ